MSTARSRSWRHDYFNLATIPFWAVHVGAIVGVLVMGWSWWGVALAAMSYFVRLFFITAGYHRYFSHRAFKTSRWFQFVLAFGGGTAVQKGALWWAANHRIHHKHSDEDLDPHSLRRRGFMWSHIGWITSTDHTATEYDKIRDFASYPELRFLNRFHFVPWTVYGLAWYLAGGLHGFLWGFVVSTVLVWHGTFVINSLAHKIGTRRYATTDDSRNHWFLALVTMGEGWHNNHHHYPSSANQGFFWWEVDLSDYVLRALALCRVVWAVRRPPARVLAQEPIAAVKAAEKPTREPRISGIPRPAAT
jgi:stearoyl-CoA desaturase (delta-9 desaturase)